MKKILKVVGGIILLFVVLLTGYYFGHKIGTQYGAQQYTKKMWLNNEIQLSTNSIMDKVNTLRANNNLPPFELQNDLCKVANKRAKAMFEDTNNNWNQQKQQFNANNANSPSSPETINNMITTTCPKCKLNTYTDIPYTSLRPEPCWNYAGKQVCEGDEGFGMLEKYTGRIATLWENDPAMKQVMLSPAKNACIGAFGGAVVLSVADLNK